MDAEFGRWLIQLGVGGLLAGVLLMFYRKDVKQYTELWQAQSKLNAEQTNMMMTVVRENTAAFVENSQILRSLHRRMDRLDILRVVPEENGRAQG